MLVQLGDVVDKIVGDEDRQQTALKYFVGGEHLESSRIKIYQRGILDADARRTLGYQFHYPFKKGDVLFMTKNPYLKKCAQVDFEGICSIATFIIRTKDTSVLLQDFLPIVLQTDLFWDYMESHKSGSVNYFITWKTLASYPFELPSIDRQREIVDLAWAVEATRVTYEKLLFQLNELVKARFVEMFGLDNSTGIPLRKCCVDIRGGGTPSMKHPEYYGGDIPFIKSGDVKGYVVCSGALSLTEKALEETNARYVPEGSILVVNRSAALLREFHASIAGCDVVINQDIKAFIPKSDFLPEYLLWAINSQTPYLLSKVITMLTSHIDMKDLLNLRIQPAPIEKQKSFVDFVHQVDKSKVAVQKAMGDTIRIFSDLQKEWFE